MIRTRQVLCSAPAIALISSLLACAHPVPSTSPPPPASDAPPASGAPETTLPIIDFFTLKTRESYDMDAARASTTPDTITFRVAAPTREGDVVTFVGLLENTADTPATLTYFASGALGFHARPVYEAAQAKPPPPGMPRMPPPVPPPPILVDIPANTAVRLTTSVALNLYDWNPGVPREIDWELALWNEPKPHGRVPVP